MTKASKLVAQLETQVSQMEERLRKKDERLKTLSGHIQELKAQLRKVEKERDWLASQHAKACLDAANDACAWSTGDCPVCPLDKGGRCLEVTSKTFIEAAEKAAKETGE